MIDIYLITNLVNNKNYVGKTQRGYLKRFEEHCTCHIHGKHTYIGDAIYKYGRDNFQIILLKQVQDDSWEYWENYYIKYYHSHYTEGGYNITWGGDSNPMDIPEVHEKHNQICKSKTFKELQRKLSMGRKHTETTKQLCRKRTLENLEICIRGFRQYNNSRKVRIGMIEAGQIVREFESASDACKYFGRPIKEAGHLLKACDSYTKGGKPCKYFGYNWTRLDGEEVDIG